MTLSNEDQAIINGEEKLLDNTLKSLTQEREHLINRQYQQSNLARELTSEIVNTIRAEEKVQIYSDEAVAHGLVQKSIDSIAILEKQIKSPYFARLELEEELPNGQIKKIEYKIGKNANPDCRIIDWRKAPIAKLYYEYNEGDFYDEVIQGQERQGEIKLKHSFEIVSSDLKKIITSSKSFQKNNQVWQKAKDTQGPKSSYSRLPDILALITAEQFKSITNDPELPVMIQGVAGSGKTAVAIHRLSWLLHEGNSEVKANEVIFTVKSPALLHYIKNSLLEFELESVTLVSLTDFLKLILRKLGSQQYQNQEISFPGDNLPTSFKRLLYSTAVEKRIAGHLENNPSFQINSTEEALTFAQGLFSEYAKIIELDQTRLISKELIFSAKDRISKYAEDACFDPEVLVLAFNIWQKVDPKKFKGTFGHLIIDEIQDYSKPELQLLLNCLKEKNQVTLLGDLNQNLNLEFGFPGWEFLKKEIATLGHIGTNLIQLKISHRSTLPIIKVAQEISGENHAPDGRPGKLPIWFSCANEDSALSATIKWIQTAQEKYPTSLTAVICSTPQEARSLYGMLAPSFSSSVRLLENDFNLAAGIVVSDVSQTKGLEFYNVLVWNVSEVNYPRASHYQRLLYVACTRAEENLSFITWSKASELLKGLPQNLIRKFNY